MRRFLGGVAVVVVCAAAAVAEDGAAPARDYNDERAALVATVVPASEGAERGWESLEAAIRAVGTSHQRIVESLRVQYGIPDGTPIDINPLILIDAPDEDADADAPAPGPDGAGGDDGKAGDADASDAKPGEAADAGADAAAGSGPVDMARVDLQGARKLMRTYEGNRVFDRMTGLRVQPQVYVPLDDKPLMMRDFSYASGVRTLARLEAARMWRFLQEGEDKKAADTFEGLLALGVVMSREPTVVGRLQSITVIGIATDTLKRWMLENRIDAELARDLLGRLQRHAAQLTPMTYTLAGERLTGLDTIARVFAREIPAPMVVPQGEAGSLQSQEENEKDLNAMYDAMDAWVSLPANERKAADPSPSELASGMPKGLVLVKILAPGLEHAEWLAEFGRVELDGVELMLALEVERSVAGTFPESLDVLVPTVLPELPRDGYAPDGKYRYKRFAEGGSHAGKAYVLYSVGYDGTDDGGTPASGNAANALGPGGAEGADYVINRRATP